jgi:hypothetical protein
VGGRDPGTRGNLRRGSRIDKPDGRPFGARNVPACGAFGLLFLKPPWCKMSTFHRDSKNAGRGDSIRRQARAMAKTVMIVEDNELNMKLFNDLLRANGYDTLPMRNGYDALDALK